MDLSKLVQKENALQAGQARREPQDAMEALPDAFALHDAEERLRVFNAR